MTSRWKTFEQSLLPVLKQHDARNRLSFWERLSHRLTTASSVPPWAGRAVVSFFLIVFTTPFSKLIGTHPDLWMALIGVGLMVITLGGITYIYNLAQTDPEYRLLWCLPVSADSISHRLLRRLAWNSVWLILEVFIAYAWVLSPAHPSLSIWACAAGWAGLQAALSFALLLLLTACQPNPKTIEYCSLTLLFLTVLMMIPAFGTLLVNALSFCNPFGCINQLFLNGCLRGHSGLWWNLALPIAVLLTLPFSLKKFRQLQQAGVFYRGITHPLPKQLTADSEHPISPDAQRQRILSGNLLLHLDWKTGGPVERLLARLLSPEEITVTEVLLAQNKLRWSRLVFDTCIYLVLALILNLLADFASLDDLTYAIVKHRQGTGVALLALLANGWCLAAMLPRITSLFLWNRSPEQALLTPSGVPLSFQTLRLLPLNYWEIAKTIARVNTLIALILLPLALLFSYSPLCQMLDHHGRFDLAILPKCVVLGWGGSIALVTFPLTPFRAMTIKAFARSLVKLMLGLPALISGMALATVRTSSQNALALVVFLLSTVFFFWYLGRCYRKDTSN